MDLAAANSLSCFLMAWVSICSHWSQSCAFWSTAVINGLPYVRKEHLARIRKLKLSCLSLFSTSWVVFSFFCMYLHICAYVMHRPCYKWLCNEHNSFIWYLLVNIPLLETVLTFFVLKQFQRKLFFFPIISKNYRCLG